MAEFVPETGESMSGFTIYNDKNEEIAEWSTVGNWIREGEGKLTKNIKIKINGGWSGVLCVEIGGERELLLSAPISTSVIMLFKYITISNINAEIANLKFYYNEDKKEFSLENIPVETSDSSLLGITENRSLDYI